VQSLKSEISINVLPVGHLQVLLRLKQITLYRKIKRSIYLNSSLSIVVSMMDGEKSQIIAKVGLSSKSEITLKITKFSTERITGNLL